MNLLEINMKMPEILKFQAFSIVQMASNLIDLSNGVLLKVAIFVSQTNYERNCL